MKLLILNESFIMISLELRLKGFLYASTFDLTIIDHTVFRERDMRKTLLTLAACAGALTTLSSCDLDGAANTLNEIFTNSAKCPEYEQQFQEEIAQEGKLIDTINPVGDYSMALVLNASSINKLFRAATEWNYVLGDKSTFGLVLQVPEIQVGGCRQGNYAQYTGDYNNCLSFEIPIEAYVAGEVYGMSAKFGVPVDVIIQSDQSRSSVYADLSRAQILNLSFGSAGTLNSTVTVILETLLRDFLLDGILESEHMFDIAAWELGDNNIRMLAGAPRINETEGTMTLGMYSNIFFSKTSSVTWDEAFPKDAEIGIHIHPDLIRGVLSRMLAEGHIDDSVELKDINATMGSTTPGFKVSMANIAKEYPQDVLLTYDADWMNYFTFAFRLWSTDTFCGYMDLLAGLKVELSDQKFKIGLGNLHAGKSAGAMSLSAAIFNTIEETSFFQQALNFVNFSFNFDQLTVSDQSSAGGTMRKAEMGAEHFQFNVNGNGISLYLNFLDL